MRVFYPRLASIGTVCGMGVVQAVIFSLRLHVTWVPVGVHMGCTYVVCAPMLALECRRAVMVGTLKSGKLAWKLHDALHLSERNVVGLKDNRRTKSWVFSRLPCTNVMLLAPSPRICHSCQVGHNVGTCGGFSLRCLSHPCHPSPLVNPRPSESGWLTVPFRPFPPAVITSPHLNFISSCLTRM